MPLKLNEIPGFADLPDSVLQADLPAYAIHLGRIAQNATFGMVRLEIFQGLYHDGDTVILPTSKVDGYNYSRDELLYFWTVRDSGNPNTGWISGPRSLSNSLWFTNWNVDQATGKVFTDEWYRRSGPDTQSQSSKDGTLLVFTIAQRLKNQIILAGQPFYRGIDEQLIGEDLPYAQGLLQSLNNDAKFACVNTEVFYMGEFVDGQTVPLPTSPADRYKYGYGELKFMPAWRWTALGSTYQQPPEPQGQLGPFKCSVSSVGLVHYSVSFIDDDGVLHTFTNFGRLMVFAFATRGGGDSFGGADVTILRPVTVLNGWGPNGHVGSYEHGVDQGFYFGFDSGTTEAYANPGNAFDADDTTAAVASYQGTHKYAGCVWGFDVPSGPSTGASVLLIDSEIPQDGEDGLIVNNRTAGIWYSLDSGSTWKQIYNTHHRTQQTDSISLPAQQDLSLVQVMAFLDSHDDMTHRVFEISIRNAPSLPTTTGPSGGPVVRSFTEIDDAFFAPGESVRASTMLAIKRDADQAVLTPEFFGPTIYKNGDTVALPTSLVDGYTYDRSELIYIWTWTDTTNGTGPSLRLPVFVGKIDPASGLVTLRLMRLPPGGPYVWDDHNLARITVLTVGFRQAQSPELFDNLQSTPPDDVFTPPVTPPPPVAGTLFGSASDLTVDLTAPVNPEDGFTIPHSLGQTPAFVKIEMTSGGNIWLDGTAYDGSNLYLKASEAGVIGKALLFRTAPAAEVTVPPTSGPGDFAIAHSLGVSPGMVLVQMRSGGNIWSQPAVADASFVYLTASDADVEAHIGLWLALTGTGTPSVNRKQIPLSADAGGKFQVPHGLGSLPKDVFVHMKSPGFPAFWFQATRYDAVSIYLVSPGGSPASPVTGFAEVLY